MKKRFLSVFLAFAMIFSLAAMTSITVSAESYSDFWYEELDDGTISITGCDNILEAANIPSKIDGKTVTSISYGAFYYCKNLKTVTIPSTVTIISECAFEECSSLTSVTIPDSVTSIGDFAFYNCKSIESIAIPDSVTSIGKNIIYGTALYKNESNWDNGALYIGKFLISGLLHDDDYDAITEVEGDYKIKDGTKVIADRAFEDCYSLTSVSIPDSVINVGHFAFGRYNNLTSISVSKNNKYYSSENGVLFDKNKTTLIRYPIEKSDEQYTIPNSVKYISESAFEDCYSITSVKIGSNVTTIGDDAFNGCSSLESITIPNSVTNIGDNAFSWCYGLTSVKLGSGLKCIGYNAFYNCDSITSVDIPSSVTEIGGYAFYACSSLESINVAADNQYYTSQNGVLFNKDKSVLIQYPADKTDKSYTIPNSVTFIDYDAFYDCDWLTSVVIPDGVTDISNDAFYGCDSLTSVTMGKGVENIGSYAFGYCTALKNITIPGSVTFIDYGAFCNCESLTSISIPGSVSSVSEYAFENCISLKNVTISDGVEYIGYNAFFNTAYYNNKSNWDNGVLYIGHYLITGQMMNDDYEIIDEVKGNYKIKDGTKFIAFSAFEDCESLTGISIPDSVTYIDSQAFYNCSSLNNVNIPNKLTSINYATFMKCTSLKNVTIPDSVTEIGDNAFDSCTGLTSVTIPEGVTFIGYSAFASCTSLKSVTIPSSATDVNYLSFGYYYDNDNDEYIKVPGFHINCYVNSTGKWYAIDNEFEYTLLDAPADTPSFTIIQPSYGTIKDTKNSDGTVTLELLANKYAWFESWNIEGDYEIVEGSLTSEIITILPKEDGVRISAVFELVTTEIYGDVNYDGNVNMLDVLLIRKYIAKQPIELNTYLADVTCDGNVNMLDVLLIRKYIAKQPVTLGPKF